MVPVVRSTTRVYVASWSGRDIRAGFGWRGVSPGELRVENGSRLRVVHVSQLAAFPVRFVWPRAVSQRFWPWQQSRLATCPGVVRCDANVKGSHPRLTQERGEKHAHADFVQRCNSCAPILDSRYLSRQIPSQEWREIERLSLRTTPDTDAVGNLDVELKIASALNLAPLEKTFREGLAFDRFRLEFPG